MIYDVPSSHIHPICGHPGSRLGEVPSRVMKRELEYSVLVVLARLHGTLQTSSLFACPPGTSCVVEDE